MQKSDRIRWVVILVALATLWQPPYAATTDSTYTTAPQETPTSVSTPEPVSTESDTATERETVPGVFLVKFKGPDMRSDTLDALASVLASLQLTSESFTPVFSSGTPFSLSDPSSLAGNSERIADRARSILSYPRRMQRAPTLALDSSGTRNRSLERIYSAAVPSGQTIENVLSALSGSAAVEWAQPVYRYRVAQALEPASFNDPLLPQLWGVTTIASQEAWKRSQGEGITVAVIDTGVHIEHEDLAPNIWANPKEIANNCIDDDNNGYIDDMHGYDFNENPANLTLCADKKTYNGVMDPISHGTHVAGTIAAVGNNSVGVVGVAPKARIMPVKGLDVDGGSSVTLARSLSYAIENGADVLNNSWAMESGGTDPLLEDVLAEAHAVGLVSVFAVGNDSKPISPTSLLSRGHTINVSASTEGDGWAFFSNYGELVSLAAPGENILSTVAPSDQEADSPYATQDGTSMAAPHVSAVAALMLSAVPQLSNATVRYILESSSDDIGDPGYDARFGFGRVNAARAVEVALAMQDGPVRVPEIQFITPRANAVFSELSESQSIAVEFLTSERVIKPLLSYRSVWDWSREWFDVPVTARADGRGFFASIPLTNTRAGHPYELRATVTSETLGLQVRKSMPIVIDERGVVTVGAFEPNPLLKKSLDISGTTISWNGSSWNGERWVPWVDMLDLISGSRHRIPASASSQHVVGSRFLYYIDGQRTLNSAGAPNPKYGLNRYDLTTGTDSILDPSQDSQGTLLGSCSDLSSYDDRAVWLKRSGSRSLLRMYSPGGAVQTLMTAQLREPRMVGESVLVVQREAGREKLLRIDATTGVADRTPLLDVPQEPTAGNLFLTTSAKQRILVQHRFTRSGTPSSDLYEYSDSTKGLQFLFDQASLSESALSELSLSGDSITWIGENHQSSQGQAIKKRSLTSAGIQRISMAPGPKALLESLGTRSVWSESSSSGTSWIKLHSTEPIPLLPLVWADTGPKSVRERVPATFNLQAAHARGGTLLYRLESAPAGASLNETTGTFTWTPLASQVGEHLLRFVAYDPANPDYRSAMELPITVVKNKLPVIDAIAPQRAFVGSPFSWCPSAYDEDFDSLRFSVKGLPAGATFSSAECLKWTPSEEQKDRSYVIDLSVADGLDTVSASLQIGVHGAAADLTIEGVRTTSLQTGADLSYPVDEDTEVVFVTGLLNAGRAASTATTVRIDIDGPQQWSTVFNTDPVAAGESLSVTSSPAWKPKPGLYVVLVTVDPEDTELEVDEENNSLSFEVFVQPVNHQPTVTSPAVVQAYAGNPVRFPIGTSDPENDPVKLSLERAPSWASISLSKEFLWTPRDSQVGTHVIRIKGTDVPAIGVPLSAFSETTINVALPPKTPPAAPTDLQYRVTYNQFVPDRYSLNFSWRDTSINETGFIIERSYGGSTSFSQVTSVSANTTSGSVPDLYANYTYLFRVCSVNAYGRACSSHVKLSIPVNPAFAPLAPTPSYPPVE